jgi:thioredoxin-related protein
LSTPSIQRAHDFIELANRAKTEHRLILLLVSRQDCRYCHLIKEEIIHPMMLGGDFKNQILIRELFIDEGETVVDFQGRKRTAIDFMHDYQVYVTPTLLFLGMDGRELEKQMTGINTVEMYWYYLSESIRAAIRKLPGSDT